MYCAPAVDGGSQLDLVGDGAHADVGIHPEASDDLGESLDGPGCRESELDAPDAAADERLEHAVVVPRSPRAGDDDQPGRGRPLWHAQPRDASASHQSWTVPSCRRFTGR